MQHLTAIRCHQIHAFSFQLENVSKYVGAGPDVGLSVQYQTPYGIGILGQFMGAMTVGRIKTQDNFTSNSTRLNTLGIGTSHQQITAPDATQVVFGADGKLGLFYEYDWLMPDQASELKQVIEWQPT